MNESCRALGLVVLLVAIQASGSRGAASPEAAILASWVALDAPTGHEHLGTGPLQNLVSGWRVDRNGNLLKTVGEGHPHRVVACGLDAHAFAASQVTDDGYLRLHRIGGGTGHPYWDQLHEGQQVRVLTRSGPRLGVVAIANGHFAEQHRHQTRITTADDLWVDVGAASRDEVADLGIRLLDPVIRHLPAWSFHDVVAGPGAGGRVGCAALVAASGSSVRDGTTTWILSTQRVFGWVGLGGAIARLGTIDELILVDGGQGSREDREMRPEELGRLGPVLRSSGLESVHLLAPAVEDPGALMERIDVAEARNLVARVGAAGGVSETESAGWVGAPSPPLPLEGAADSPAAGPDSDKLREVHRLLDRLAETPAVPGHEGPVRAIVLSELPAWARKRAETDELGNVWVAAGPEGEATVFIAHMDEVGFEIESIEADGTVRLTRRGGVVLSAWEGQPARLQLDPGRENASASSSEELSGVFLTRSDRNGSYRPDSVAAWFGLDGEELRRAGVRPGMGVTGYKEGHRLGRFRYTSRSLDDRAGTTALLLAIKAIDPEALDHRLLFVWSVQEEGGLVGAAALARRYGTSSRRVYSVDTFVSSDTPLESPHFAYAPLGAGPVLRSVESTSMVPAKELERNLAIARGAGLQVQLGLTQGGTDGTNFTFWGAPNAGLGWPGRYSHSPAEVLDLRDLAALADLVLALALAVP